MRQAGRYMPEYRALRERHGFLELCKTPEVAAEVTLQPVERLGVDAAILFADILLIARAAGRRARVREGRGPGDPPAGAHARPTSARLERRRRARARVGVRVRDRALVRRALRRRVPLIGFAGAPFTLASYVIEGGGSRDYLHTKALMYGDAGGVAPPDGACSSDATATLPQRPGRRRRAGGAALRLLGRRLVARRLPRATCCRTCARVIRALAPGDAASSTSAPAPPRCWR